MTGKLERSREICDCDFDLSHKAVPVRSLYNGLAVFSDSDMSALKYGTSIEDLHTSCRLSIALVSRGWYSIAFGGKHLGWARVEDVNNWLTHYE